LPLYTYVRPPEPAGELLRWVDAMKTSRFILLIIVAMAAGCAARSDIIILDERLAALEGQIEKQNTQIRKYSQNSQTKEKKLRNQSAGLRIQLDELREEIQIINGKLEEIEFLVGREKKTGEDADKMRKAQVDRLQESTKTMDNRLASIEQYLDLGTPTAIAPGTKAAGEKPKSIRDEKLSANELYQMARQAFDKAEYDAARDGFEELIKRYPKAKNTDNAQFWIGEIYYREKWYKKAIVEYDKVIKNYPKGNKIKSALLKQGYAFVNIGDKSTARHILNELIRKYPKSNEAATARVKLKQIK
jgi:tol-pal system protein YbgF